MSIKGDCLSSKPLLIGDLYKDVKVKAPKPFKGERSKLKGFIIYIDLYFTFYLTYFKSDIERILYIILVLKGEALN